MTNQEQPERQKKAYEVENYERMEDGTPARRVKILMINAYEFVPLFTKGMVFKRYTELINGAPKDAKILAMSGETQRHGILFVVESKEYPLVPLTEIPPIQLVAIQTKLKGATKVKASKRKK